MSRKIVYIIGKYRDPDPVKIEKNIADAFEIGKLVIIARSEWTPVPHLWSREFRDIHGIPESYWLDSTMEFLYRSDAALVMSSWKTSKGSYNELQSCIRENIPYAFLPNNPTVEEVGRLLDQLSKQIEIPEPK